jgi:chemotaxis protein histidine kinase CheA
MIKAFINEDIYCALIYDSKKEFFVGIITISDILYLFQYIIKKAQEIKITNYNNFIKEIFNINKSLTNEEEEEKNENTKDKNFNILKYLTKINYNDYYEVIKKYNKYHILYSISLDSSLLDVLKVIYKVGVHRLVVEETKKKGLTENKRKETEINLQNNLIDNKLENEEKEKVEKINKEKSETEKSNKKIKKVKTKKKVKEEEEAKETKETKEGEKVIKKKVTKKKKKTDTELDEKEKEENENKEEGVEKVVKKKVKKVVKKKKTENNLNEENKDKENKESKEKKEEDKKTEEKKDTQNFQKSEKSVIEIDDSNKDVLNMNFEETSKTLELPSETQNFTGFVTYETVFDFLIYNYYSMEMKEFDLTLEELKNLPLDSSFIKPLNNFSLMNEEVHSSFSKNISSKTDILPILTNDKNDIFGFLYLRDYLFFVSNCESNQNLTNEQFLINMYEGIENDKPYGKERIIYLEYDDESKKLSVKGLLEKINGAPEKKIILKVKEDGNKLYIISLKSIFDALVEMNEN